MSLHSRIVPGSSNREDFPLAVEKAALVVIDIQKYLSSPQPGDSGDDYFYSEALPGAIEKISSLLKAFRMARDTSDNGGCEVIFCYLQSATKDGRDISWDYKLSGPLLTNIPTQNESIEDLFLEAVKPDTTTGKGDILLPKTSCSVFMSTNLDYLLRNLGIEQVVFVGQLTDQCVESAVRDAADLGYLVTLAEDASAAKSPQSHQKGIHGATGFARIVQSAQVIEELSSGASADIAVPIKSNQPEASAVLEYLEANKLETAAAEMKHFLETGEKPSPGSASTNRGKVSPEKKKMVASSLVAWAKSVNNEESDPSKMSGQRKLELAVLLRAWAKSVNGAYGDSSPATSSAAKVKVVENFNAAETSGNSLANPVDPPVDDPGTPKKKKGLFGRLGRGKSKKSGDEEILGKEEVDKSQSAKAQEEEDAIEEVSAPESPTAESKKSKKGWFGRNKKTSAEESKDAESESNVENAEPSESVGAGSEDDVQEATETQEPVSPGKKKKGLFGRLKKGIVGSKKVKEDVDDEEIEEAIPESQEVPSKMPEVENNIIEVPEEPDEAPKESAPEPAKKVETEPKEDVEPNEDPEPAPTKPKKKKKRDGPEEHPVQEIIIDTTEEEEPKKEKRHKKSKKSEKSDDKKAPKRTKSHKSKSKSDGGSSEEKKKKKRSSEKV